MSGHAIEICVTPAVSRAMNLSLMRRSLLARRRDRPSRMVLTIGSVNAVLGGVSLHGSLLLLGLVIMGVGIALRLRQPVRPQSVAAPPPRSLPPAPSDTAL
jgi:hypothetical protein